MIKLKQRGTGRTLYLDTVEIITTTEQEVSSPGGPIELRTMTSVYRHEWWHVEETPEKVLSLIKNNEGNKNSQRVRDEEYARHSQ